jgi:pyruvate dehydrogenase E2 component (dihydrolipoamide acetyltransferase)
MAEIVMPRLSDTMEEGTILRWLKGDGEQIARGEELAEIETDKATMTYESDQQGILEILAPEGATLAVGEVIARVGDGATLTGDAATGDDAARDDAAGSDTAGDAAAGSDTIAAEPPVTQPAAEAEQRSESSAPAGERASASGTGADGEQEKATTAAAAHGEGQDGRVKASPLARRIAGESGIDLHELTGSGPGGRIVKDDVTQAVDAGAGVGADVATGAQVDTATESVATAKGQTTDVELTRTQQTIARRMAESKATIPDFALVIDVDMNACVELRAELKRIAHPENASAEPAGAAKGASERLKPPTYNDMVVKACALALREYPSANGSYRDGRLQLHSRVNVGVAVAAANALVVPTVFDADEKSLGEIARETHALAERVRSAAITPPELGGGTFTVSNLGMYGVKQFTAIINPPQAAILSVGAVEQRAVVRDNQVQARQTMTLTLVCDHRILYGAEAAQFLERIRELLQTPSALTL